MIRTINGHKYLMRDTRPTKELRQLYKQFVEKYGLKDTLTFHDWLADRGKIHIEIKER